MKPGIDPKVDYAFKKVFGSESNIDLLQDLLEAVLGFALSAVEIINPFNDKDDPDGKLSVLDIKARDGRGRWFDVEMQTHSHTAIRPRMIYYWAQLYAGQLVEGQSFTELRPAYSICFLDARMFPRRPDVYHNTFGLVDGGTGEVLTDHLGIHVLELPKFALGADDLTTPKEKWCYFLKHAESLDAEQLPATMADPPVKKAMEVLMRMSQSAQERDRYENRVKWERDITEMKKDAYEEGEEKGMEKGRIVELSKQIAVYQRLLKQTPTPPERLAQMSLDDLRRLAEDLERQLLPPAP